jgi:hypothetical protein
MVNSPLTNPFLNLASNIEGIQITIEDNIMSNLSITTA